MEDKTKWDIDGKTLTITIHEQLTTKDLAGILNSVVRFERDNIDDYHTKYTNWNVVVVDMNDNNIK